MEEGLDIVWIQRLIICRCLDPDYDLARAELRPDTGDNGDTDPVVVRAGPGWCGHSASGGRREHRAKHENTRQGRGLTCDFCLLVEGH